MNQTGIPVYLPKDVQQEIYNEILALTFTAIEKAKKERAVWVFYMCS